MTKQKLLIIVGPTAVGKTALSIEIAKRFNLEVISGDSMQVYKGMDIGTGKITDKEKNNIPHHMLSIIYPNESFSVQEFQKRVKTLIKEQVYKGKMPFIVGGTGLYIKSLIYDYDFNKEDKSEKNALIKKYEQYSNDDLHSLLKDRDFHSYTHIHKNNRVRLIRSLVKLDMNQNDVNKAPNDILKYDTFIIGLTTERQRLYERINTRVEDMFNQGLETEVKNLYHQYELSQTAKMAIGYKEFCSYFNGEDTIETVKELIQKNSRQYAKRQLTFFRNQLPVCWYDLNEVSIDNILMDVDQFIKGDKS